MMSQEFKAKKLKMGQVWIEEKVSVLTYLKVLNVEALPFEVGETVKIIGISKGRGFAGVVKRHGFAGGPKTHGQSDRWRAPGSIGGTTTPGRVYKGKRMAGRMGGERVTVKNLKVIGVDIENKILAVKGAVPGRRGTLVEIKSS